MTIKDLLKFELKIHDSSYHTSYFFKLSVGEKYILYKNRGIIISDQGLYESRVILNRLVGCNTKYFIEENL